MHIAILGATSHIAKGLIDGFIKQTDVVLYLFARDIDKTRSFMDSLHENKCKYYIDDFKNFESDNYSVIINCIGFGYPEKVKAAGINLFLITEMYDNMALRYLENNTNTLYINFSSGAVYGIDFDKGVNKNTISYISMNNISPSDFYRISKINSEAKHRALGNLNIVDIRVFSYFSRFINLASNFFLTELISAALGNREFVTNSYNMVRDYSNPHDLFQLVTKCINQKELNDVFDLYTKKPCSKFELIDYFQDEYNLKYKIIENYNIISTTGTKNNYFSNNHKAETIGYKPEYSSIEGIKRSLACLKN